MNGPLSTTSRLCTRWSTIVLSGVLTYAFAAIGLADEPKPSEPAKPTKKDSKKVRKELTGAELYAIHCNRCHPERYSPERTEVQWKTILTHMRVRANLPAQQAKAVLKFLQEDSGK